MDNINMKKPLPLKTFVFTEKMISFINNQGDNSIFKRNAPNSVTFTQTIYCNTIVNTGDQSHKKS